jgi:hypothetical protein
MDLVGRSGFGVRLQRKAAGWYEARGYTVTALDDRPGWWLVTGRGQSADVPSLVEARRFIAWQIDRRTARRALRGLAAMFEPL